MDIKLFADDKEIIAPLFDFGTKDYENNQILIVYINNFSNKEQDDFFSVINKISTKNLYINSDYIAITTDTKIYFFSLDNYKDYKFENAIISGYYDLMFVFVDINNIIINREYKAMNLNGLQFKQL